MPPHPAPQAELDHKAEQVASLSAELEVKHKQLAETTRWGGGRTEGGAGASGPGRETQNLCGTTVPSPDFQAGLGGD